MPRVSTSGWCRLAGIAALFALFSAGQLQAQAAFEALSQAAESCPEVPIGGTAGDWDEAREAELLALLPKLAEFEKALDKELVPSRTQMDRDMLMNRSIFWEYLGAPGQPPVPFRAARKVASLAQFCGWLRMARGEPITAIRRDLQALRVGMDLVRSATMLIDAMTGVSIERSVWESLGNKLMDGGLDPAQFQRVSKVIRAVRLGWDFRPALVKALDRGSDSIEWMVKDTVGKVAGSGAQVDEALRLMREYDGGVRDCLREDVRLIDRCVRIHVKSFMAAGHEKRNSILGKCLANYGNIGARVAETFAMREMIVAALVLAEFRVTQGRAPRDSNELAGLPLDPLSRIRTRSIMKPDVQLLGMSGNDQSFQDYDPERDLVLAPRALRQRFKALTAYVKPLDYRRALALRNPDGKGAEPTLLDCEQARLELQNGIMGLWLTYHLEPVCHVSSLQPFLVANRLMRERVKCRDGGVMSWQDGKVSCSGPPAPVPETPVPTTVSVWGTASCTENLAALEIAVKFFNIDNNAVLTDLSEQTQAKMIAAGYVKAGARCADGGVYTLDGWLPRCSKHPNSESGKGAK